MLEVEAALARAEADAGVIPPEAATAIAAACAGARLDVAALGRDAAASASPVVPLVAALRAAAGAAADGCVHWGATSQDVLDTAMMLVSRRALDVLIDEAEGLAEACAALAERHRGTPMAGRTLLQQAVPITFGLKAAGWLVAVDAAADRLAEVRGRGLAVQLGGAAGTLGALGDRGLDVLRRLAAGLALPEPVLPWHAARGRVAELGGALALAGGTAGKIALDVALLAQPEVGEAAEDAPGGSSAMPHKRNPATAVAVLAAVRGLEAQAAVLGRALLAEHERAAGAWQAEWPALAEAFRLAGGAVGRTRRMVAGLRVDERRMRANLERSGGLTQSEAVVAALAARAGRTRARELVDRVVAAGGAFGDALLADPDVAAHLRPEEIEAALDPARALGSAAALVDRALAHHRGRR
jgi:3-carboxy-cis,cis-muconate cycloisomerase